VTNTNFNMVALAGFGGSFSAGIAINADGLAVGFADDGTSVKGASWMVTAAISLSACGGGGGGGGGGDGGGGTTPSGGGGGGGTVQTPVTNTNFNMVALAGFGGSFSAGIAINADGLAVGFADDGTSVKGASWTVTDATPTPTELSPLDGNSYSAAYGVNGAGVAVGESGNTVNAVPDANTVAVVWSTDVAVALPTTGLLAGGASAAFSINDDGEIVGEAVNDAEGNTVALYWASSAVDPLMLGNLPGGSFSSAYFIGADGRIVGEAENGSGQAQAVVWLPAVGVGYQAPVPLTAVTNQIASAAFGADLNGRIVGEAELASGAVHGIIWNANGSVAADLGADTSAQAISNADRIVGYNAALTGNDRAVVWNGADIADTRSLAAVFSHAYGVNDSTQIVGFSGGQAFAAIPQ
jgi:uncharacterized membrane protein